MYGAFLIFIKIDSDEEVELATFQLPTNESNNDLTLIPHLTEKKSPVPVKWGLTKITLERGWFRIIKALVNVIPWKHSINVETILGGGDSVDTFDYNAVIISTSLGDENKKKTFNIKSRTLGVKFTFTLKTDHESEEKPYAIDLLIKHMENHFAESALQSRYQEHIQSISYILDSIKQSHIQ